MRFKTYTTHNVDGLLDAYTISCTLPTYRACSTSPSSTYNTQILVCAVYFRLRRDFNRRAAQNAPFAPADLQRTFPSSVRQRRRRVSLPTSSRGIAVVRPSSVRTASEARETSGDDK